MVLDTNELFFENLIDKKLLANKMAVSVSYVDKLMVEGLPYYKIGRSVRFLWGDVVSWLQERRMQ